MNRLIMMIILLILSLNIDVISDVRVRAYTRKDGTYVKAHYRTEPNNTINDNFSTVGNVNPYTGKPGWIPREGSSYGSTGSTGNTHQKNISKHTPGKEIVNNYEYKRCVNNYTFFQKRNNCKICLNDLVVIKTIYKNDITFYVYDKYNLYIIEDGNLSSELIVSNYFYRNGRKYITGVFKEYGRGCSGDVNIYNIKNNKYDKCYYIHNKTNYYIFDYRNGVLLHSEKYTLNGNIKIQKYSTYFNPDKRVIIHFPYKNGKATGVIILSEKNNYVNYYKGKLYEGPSYRTSYYKSDVFPNEICGWRSIKLDSFANEVELYDENFVWMNRFIKFNTIKFYNDIVEYYGN